MPQTPKDEILAKRADEVAKLTTARKESPSGSTLDDKIARASIDVGAFLPDRTNEQANYQYVSADQIARRAGDALAREGVVIYPEIKDATVEIQETPKGNSRFCVARVSFVMHISAGDAAEQKRDLRWISLGVDYSSPDKAIAKAITTGVKYFSMKLLQVGIGNDDGEHENPPAREEARKPIGDLDLENVAREIKSPGAFFDATLRYFSVNKDDTMKALDGLSPRTWVSSKEGRTIQSALQRVLDYSIERASD